MARVLRPGGRLLIANLNNFNTAIIPETRIRTPDGQHRFHIDYYLDERATWQEWRGIRILNWHRPLATYMTLLLDAGLELRHFAEPAPVGGDAALNERYRRSPYFIIMEWEKRPAS